MELKNTPKAALRGIGAVKSGQKNGSGQRLGADMRTMRNAIEITP